MWGLDADKRRGNAVERKPRDGFAMLSRRSIPGAFVWRFNFVEDVEASAAYLLLSCASSNFTRQTIVNLLPTIAEKSMTEASITWC